MLPKNILFGFLPETVFVSGKEYPINTDFKTWLFAGDIISSGKAPERFIPILLSKCYKDEIPENTFEAVSALVSFYKNAFPKYKCEGKGSSFSSDFDGTVLYSGFLKNYGIDLSTVNMHWYRFAPLMLELSNCIFSKVMEIRGTDISAIKPEIRNTYIKIKTAFALPSEKVAETDFAEELFNIF